MTNDLIERAEAALEEWGYGAQQNESVGEVHVYCNPAVVVEVLSPVVAALKAERAKHARLQKYVTQHSDLCICDKAGLGHYDNVSCKVHADD